MMQISPEKQNGKQSGSPTRYTRLHEKQDLANLNNRLACYIDRVRNLETENYRLNHELQSAQDVAIREVSAVKSLYKRELTEARKLLDELSREKAKLQIDTQHLFAENDSIKEENSKKDTIINNLHLELSQSQKHVADLSNKSNALDLENNRLHNTNKTFKGEKLKLTEELNLLNKRLEEEILIRVDAENSLQSFKDEYLFNEQLLNQQLIETKKNMEIEKSKIDGQLNQEYEERLCHSLQEIRDQYESDLEENKKQLKKIFAEKIKS